MTDKPTKWTAEALQQVEQQAEEPIQAAMVKTAIRSNVGGESAWETAEMEDVLRRTAQPNKRETNV
jgi:hypothetical protein